MRRLQYLLRSAANAAFRADLLRVARNICQAGLLVYRDDFWFTLESAKLAGSLSLGEEAASSARKATRIDPESAEAARLLIKNECRFGDLDRAIREAQRVRFKGMPCAESCSETGWALVERGEAEQALKWIDEALELEPGREDSLLARADAYRELGRPAEAEEIYRRLRVEANEMWVRDEASVDLVLAVFDQGRRDEALELATATRTELRGGRATPSAIARLEEAIESIGTEV